jgi:hypothetical protein
MNNEKRKENRREQISALTIVQQIGTTVTITAASLSLELVLATAPMEIHAAALDQFWVS